MSNTPTSNTPTPLPRPCRTGSRDLRRLATRMLAPAFAPALLAGALLIAPLAHAATPAPATAGTARAESTQATQAKSPIAPLTATTAPASTAWSIDQLMSALAHRRAGRVQFVETKYLAMLERPVESTGELAFTAPDRLEKRTFTPKAENMVIEGDMMTVERAGKSYTLPLQNYPEIAAFIESVRATLAGNRDVLERYYKITLGGNAERWTLTLTPVDSRMAKAVQTIRIDGAADRLDRVEIRQADGDRSVMAIRQAATP
jgi:outer membrane lipoprotein-sorting protein